MSSPVCIITGASRGIGLATALRFGRTGGQLLIAARDTAALERARAQISSTTGADCEALSGDVGDSAFAAALVNAAVTRYGRVDILVNNAGVAPLANVAEMEFAAFEQLVDTNIRAVFHLTRAVWPHMKKQGQGTIVNVSSVAAFDALPGLGTYGASKAWVSAFTRFAAEEGRADNIRVFAIAPGAVETQMLRSVAPDIPDGVTLDPDDVAGAIEAVCDPRLKYATGQTIVVRR